jgi:hypothetical protein
MAAYLRPGVALGIAVVVGLGLGYALSWEPDEQAAYERAAAEQQARVRERVRQDLEAARARAPEIRAARIAAEAERRARVRDSLCGGAPVSVSSECQPVSVEGAEYVVELEPADARAGERPVNRVRVYDDSARLVYDENVAAMVEVPMLFSDPEESEMDAADSAALRDAPTRVRAALVVEVLEDAGGRPRGLLFTYRPWGGGGSFSYRIVVPRAGKLQSLAPQFSKGTVEWLPRGSQANSRRLLEGNRFFTWDRRAHLLAFVLNRVDFDCEGGAPACVAFASDSIGGLPRFAVSTDGGQPRLDTTATIELFNAPGARVKPARVTLQPGTMLELLGAAGRLPVGPMRYREYVRWQDEDWLNVRINGRTGWIHGAAGFAAIDGVGKKCPEDDSATPPGLPTLCRGS